MGTIQPGLTCPASSHADVLRSWCRGKRRTQAARRQARQGLVSGWIADWDDGTRGRPLAPIRGPSRGGGIISPRARGGAMSDYDTDFYTWTQTQAAALREKDWAALDVAHLAEEIA